MGSKGSKAKRPTPAKTKAVIVPRAPQDTVPIPPQDITPTPPRDTIPIPSQDTVPVLPQDIVPIIPQDTIPTIPHDIINEILDHVVSNSDSQSLRACALVSKPWVQPCRCHLFHTTLITPTNACSWLKTFPAQEDSPAHYVKDLRLEIGKATPIPDQFFKCIPWFTAVDKMSFLGYGAPRVGYRRYSPLRDPSLWKLPKSVTSLTIYTAGVNLLHARDIIARLPNLDDLVLSGFAEPPGRRFPGIGTVLKGRFGGRLSIRAAYAGEDIINMLLEIPSGLQYAELEIFCTGRCHHSSAVRLAEACGKTLVKLLYTLGWKDYKRLERSFNFSKLPNVQEVTFGFSVGWGGEVLPWIPMALSTLRPTTSPRRLSDIRLNFCLPTSPPVEALITGMEDDLRRIADEVARIEREFEGTTLNLTVVSDSKFDTLNVRFCSAG